MVVYRSSSWADLDVRVVDDRWVRRVYVRAEEAGREFSSAWGRIALDLGSSELAGARRLVAAVEGVSR